MDTNKENLQFYLASQVVNYTGCNLFLTGKAGTGKTTFLKQLKETTTKNTVVLAPTGVAAINAGGVTIHSFFQLPFGPYLPVDSPIFAERQATDRYSLIKNLRLGKPKIELIRSLDLLVIDEISMVRADVLDAIDEVLRHYRKNPHEAFGGVQMLFIGDLFQLPPVAGDEEWALLREVYKSPFFFHSKAIEKSRPLFIELKKVYRQSEQDFLELLNNIRHNSLTAKDWQMLQFLQQNQLTYTDSKPITLTTHNYMADQINKQELSKLPGKSFVYKGVIEGDFSERALPAEKELELKVGAQVMFIKNDTDPEKRYFNGKLGRIKELSESNIVVIASDNNKEIKISKEKWSNVRYHLNKATQRIEEEELGSFEQFPLRLAWAVTIHKSQGLTFDKVIIDAGSAFAAGQVYVALSRCRTLEGIQLKSTISPMSIKSDERIIAFSSQEHDTAEIEALIEKERPKYAALVLLRAFEFNGLLAEAEEFAEFTEEKDLPEKEWFNEMATELQNTAANLQETALKFVKQLGQILTQIPIDETLLNQRVIKGKEYFINGLNQHMIEPLATAKVKLKSKSKVKTYLKVLDDLQANIWKKLDAIQKVSYGDLSFEVARVEQPNKLPKEAFKKPAKGSTQLESFAFYKQGLSIEAIAKERGMATATIEGHLATFVAKGEIDIYELVDKPLVEKISAVVKELDKPSLTQVKEQLKEEASFGQIKMVMAHLENNS